MTDEQLDYERIMDTYTHYVIAVIYKVSGKQLSTEDIEDLCAEVFIKFWEKRLHITLEEAVIKAYLGSMARNMTLNKLKKEQRNQLIPLEEDALEIEQQGVEEEIIQKEDRQVMDELLDSLGEPDKEIFVRRYFYMEKVNDIAATLKLNRQTVGTKLFRGKKKLKALLLERRGIHE